MGRANSCAGELEIGICCQDGHSQQQGGNAGQDRLWGWEPLGPATRSLRTLHRWLDQQLTLLLAWARNNSLGPLHDSTTPASAMVVLPLWCLAGFLGFWWGLMALVYYVDAVSDHGLLDSMAGAIIFGCVGVLVVMCSGMYTFFWAVLYLPQAAVALLRAVLLGLMLALGPLLGLLLDSLLWVCFTAWQTPDDSLPCAAKTAGPAKAAAPAVAAVQGNNENPGGRRQGRCWWAAAGGIADRVAATCELVNQGLAAFCTGPCTRPLASVRCQLDQQLSRAQQWTRAHALALAHENSTPKPPRLALAYGYAALMTSLGCGLAAAVGVMMPMTDRYHWFDTAPGATFRIASIFPVSIVVGGPCLVVLLFAPIVVVVLLRAGVWVVWLAAVLLVGLPADCMCAGCAAVRRLAGCRAAAAPVSAQSLLNQQDSFGFPSSAAAAGHMKGRPSEPPAKPADGMELNPLLQLASAEP